MTIEVHKFGGTSMGDAARMTEAARIIAGREARCVVVASAMSGVTDRLLEAAAHAVRGDTEAALAIAERILHRHHEARVALGGGPEVGRAIDVLVGQLSDVLRAVALIGDLHPRTRDRIVATGEKLAVRLVAVALANEGRAAVPRDADTFLETDDAFGEADPVPGITERAIRAALSPALERGEIPVVTGFCGRGPDGATTTLGRGGSDYTATILGAALGAREVTLWSDVDGVYSADPRVVPEARVIEQLNYREAGELSFYGAKVLHQRTMIPVARLGIPVRSRNTMRPEAPGTVVDGRFTPGSHPVKAISAIRDQALLSIEGKGMAGVPGVAARAFGALAGAGVSVTMISQSSSESSICLAVPASQALPGEAALKEAFRDALGRGDVEEIVVRGGVALVAAVGLGMAHRPGVAARVFAALGARRINVLAIAQGSSELNISLAVEQAEAPAAIRALHEGFGLHRADTGVDRPDGLDLLLLGCGKVGRALVELIEERRPHILERFGVVPRVVAIADRGGYVLEPAGFGPERLRELLDAKACGRPLTAVGGVASADPSEMVRAALAFRLSRPLLVDVSDADGNVPAMREALRLGADVVTANKKPLAGPVGDFDALAADAKAHGRVLRAEATVGAGLPVIDTLEMLMATGDRLRAAEGCLSGTLGYLMDQLGQGVAFSEAVAEAVRRGYTEPDPVADLCGADVARKAVIIGRISGLCRVDEVALEGLVDASWAGLPLDALLERLRGMDAAMRARVDEARARGEVLRYVARVEPGAVKVGLQSVPIDSPLGMLRGSDNMIVFRSDRYADRPLVVSGPGAGVDVTAMGMLGDVLRVAAERR